MGIPPRCLYSYVPRCDPPNLDRGDAPPQERQTVSRNWRLTFCFAGEDAVDIDLEDDHGG